MVKYKLQSNYKISKEVLDNLQNRGLIDPKVVIWWQKGFEGRRVFSEDEFSQGLTETQFETFLNLKLSPDSEQRKYRVWNRDDVPIVLRDYLIGGTSVKTFISVKPMSHDGNEGWRFLESSKRDQPSFPLSVYHSPHIRGVVVEDTSDFLFWLPFGEEKRCRYYSTYASNSLFENQDMPLLIMPIFPSKFCKNLMDGLRHGRLAQVKTEEWNISEEGLEVTPYYDFDPEKKHLMVFPAQVLEKGLDIPLIVKGDPLEILGSGFIDYDLDYTRAVFLKLDQKKMDRAKRSLTERLNISF